jgi:phosphonate transport system permease protein
MSIMQAIKKMFVRVILVSALLVGALLATRPATIGLGDIIDGVKFLRHWMPPSSQNLTVVLLASMVTLSTAFLGASVGLAIGLPLAFLASARLAMLPRPLMGILRSTFVVLRSIPEIVVALILLVIFGPGPFSAVLAISFHNCGVLAKLLAERIDEASHGTFEALIAAGAPKSTAATFGMLPEIWPSVLAQYFYRLEVGVRASIALGLIGAGGIGQQLINHFKTFQYREVSTDVLVIMIVIGIVDFISIRMQRSYV